MKTVFLRALEALDKATALLGAIREPEAAQGKQRFEVDPLDFHEVQTSPFAYWISPRLRMTFRSLPPFEAAGRTAKQGLATTDDFRFLRTWWGVPPEKVRAIWFPFTKGGAFAPFFADIKLYLDWRRNGAQSWAIYHARRDVVGGIIKNPDYYFRPGFSWPLRGVRFSAHAVPSGCIFSIGGKMAFAPQADLECFLGVLNSLPFDRLLCVFAGKVGGVQYQNGLVQIVPVPHLSPEHKAELATLTRRAWSMKRALDTRNETSHAFALPALLQVEGAALVARSRAWADRVLGIEREVATIQSEIDARSFDLYGIDEADRRAITEGFGARSIEEAPSDGANDAEEDDVGGDTDESKSSADATGLSAELVSWAVGVVVGRFDVRLATGGCPMPTEPEPFDALPACSPGMLTGEDGLPLARPPAAYPLAFPEAGVLVDDLGHAQDLLTAVRAVFDTVFGSDADRWWSDVAALLDPKSHDLRVWLAGSFFEYHLKRYSKSRRKAPILWQLGTPSGRYSVWLYAHRLTRDSFFQLQNEVVGPKLLHEERQLTSLIQNAGGSPSASKRKEIATQEAFVEELRAMHDAVKRVAPLWNPNLDDGVVLTMAPLWRLVPQHKPWQRELKTRWDELVAGKYDWAHVAMYLWPERVVPKCATDRSLAIAHGVEDVFWVEDADGKWKARTTPTRSVRELVGERSSPAIAAARDGLLEASVAPSAGRRERGAARGSRSKQNPARGTRGA